MENGGIYLIKDEFFEMVADSNLKINSGKKRPHYYCFKDSQDILWMIPLTSRVEKYKTLIEKRAGVGKETNFIKILSLGTWSKSVLLIQDMFPIKQEYIDRPYVVNGHPLVIKSEKEKEDIDKKARKMLKLIKRGGKNHSYSGRHTSYSKKIKRKAIMFLTKEKSLFLLDN